MTGFKIVYDKNLENATKSDILIKCVINEYSYITVAKYYSVQ